MAWKHPNVYIAVSGHAPKYWDPKLVKFLNSRGIGKCVWGTDYPLILPRREFARDIDALNLKPHAKQALLHDTAAQILGLEEVASLKPSEWLQKPRLWWQKQSNGGTNHHA